MADRDRIRKTADTINIIVPGIPTLDRCPILPKLQVYTVPQGSTVWLQRTIRDYQLGLPVDLSPALDGEEQSIPDESVSAAVLATGRVELRMRDITLPPQCQPEYEVVASIKDQEAGLVQAKLTPAITKYSGLFHAHWGLWNEADELICVNASLVSIEASLFGFDFDTSGSVGCPTLSEIRMALRDNAPAENPLLQAVEFDDGDIISAVSRCIREFNETPPDLGVTFTSKNFVWREAWLKGTVGYLYDTQSKHYFRNQLDYSAGGVSIDDKNRGPVYQQLAQGLLSQWREFVLRQKAQINLTNSMGEVWSQYGRHYGGY